MRTTSAGPAGSSIPVHCPAWPPGALRLPHHAPRAAAPAACNAPRPMPAASGLPTVSTCPARSPTTSTPWSPPGSLPRSSSMPLSAPAPFYIPGPAARQGRPRRPLRPARLPPAMDGRRWLATAHTGRLGPSARALARLLKRLGRGTSHAHLAATARELSAVALRTPPWTRRYLASILTGSLEPGPALRAAIANLASGRRLAAPPGSRRVTVVVPAGVRVSPGAILATSEQFCAVTGCGARFIPNTPRRRKCYSCSPLRTRRS